LLKFFSTRCTVGCPHGIPSTRNSPINTEFPHQHGIPPRHRIPSTRNSAYFFTSIYSVCYAMLFIFFTTLSELRGIPRILRASLYNIYEFKYFKCKFVRIKSKISRLAEVEYTSFFLSPLIANPLISHTDSVL
jgi:hypothetical protein